LNFNAISSQKSVQPKVTLASVLDLAGERVFGFLFVLLLCRLLYRFLHQDILYIWNFIVDLARSINHWTTTSLVPEKWLNHQIPIEKVQGFIKAGLPWLQKIELISRPRLTPIVPVLSDES
jgi:hypothetical protein